MQSLYDDANVVRSLLFCAALLLSGCAFTTVSPARSLERGELVVQGAIDEPGTLIIPRLSGAVTYGFGAGDVGVHLGTSVVNVNVGATARVYTSKNSVLSLQADGFITPAEVNLFDSGQRYGALSVTPRFGRLLTRGEWFYYGFELIGILPFNVAASWDLPSNPGLAAGGYLGAAFDLDGPVDLQLELSAAPVGLFSFNEGQYEVTPTPIAQIGLAVQYRPRDKERPKPTQPAGETQTPPHDGRIY